MENEQQTNSFQPALLCVIVSEKQTKRIAAVAHDNNSPVGTFMYGEGSVREKFLRFLGLDNVRREIAFFINDLEHILQLSEAFDKELNFNPKNTGIQFIVPLSKMVGTILSDEKVIRGEKKEEDIMHQAIVTIVDRGLAPSVVEVAQDAGAQGGTILHGRGTGRYQVKKIFNMEIEPEKEIILIIAKTEEVDKICKAINDDLGLDQPNTGILFTFPLLETKGMG